MGWPSKSEESPLGAFDSRGSILLDEARASERATDCVLINLEYPFLFFISFPFLSLSLLSFFFFLSLFWRDLEFGTLWWVASVGFGK